MYNAEKFLPVCLESILNQTFTDFELLVVDDCSTDSSYAIAESYLEKFGGRLKIISLPQNTGSGAVPRNIGLDLSQGKYVYFVDNDDLIVDNALETLYNYAENFQAEVVYTDRIFVCDAQPVPTKLNVTSWSHMNSLVDEPVFETNGLSERIEMLLAKKFHWAPWTKFFRRNFLVDNEIKFPKAIIWEDIAWTFQALCLAEKFLRVPTPLYVHRRNENSLLRSNRTAEQNLSILLRSLPGIMKYVDEFMRKMEAFQKNPNVFLNILQIFATTILADIEHFACEFSPKKSYDLFHGEFSKDNEDCAALISYLLVMDNIYRNELKKRAE